MLAGCGQDSWLKPEVGLSSFRITKMKFLRGDCMITLRISNPNPDPLTLEGVRVAIASQGDNFAKGMVAANRSIPAYSHVEIGVPGSVSNLTLLQVAGKMFKLKSKIAYGMDVTMTVRSVNGARSTVTAEKSGTLPIQLPDLTQAERLKAFQTDPEALLETLTGKKRK
jgi:LEA14-like dessication related protein